MHWKALHEMKSVPDGQEAWVPGSFEMPVVAKAMAKSGKFDAVITVGAVVSQLPAPLGYGL